MGFKSYYNEIDRFRVRWLQNLMAEGIIPTGDIDTRSIWDVKPADLSGYAQCHFFAGIGGWPIALRMAGWPDNLPVWTGSCPCQPFSSAGKRTGFADERHLWPAWFWLIDQCHPAVIFGEQVACKEALAWMDVVSADLAGAGYAVEAADLCAASVGAPHIRPRLWFVGWLEDAIKAGYRIPTARLERSHIWETDNAGASSWDDYEWVACADGKWRPTEPGIHPLAYGLLSPSPAVSSYGDAIVPQVAAEFIQAWVDMLGEKLSEQKECLLGVVETII